MFAKVFTYLFVFISLLGCGATPPEIPADVAANRFYKAIVQKDYQAAAAYYSDIIPLEDRMQELQTLQQEMGDLQDFELIDANSSTVYSGIRHFYKYKLHYTKGVLTELLIMFENVSGDPVIIEARKYRLKSHTSG